MYILKIIRFNIKYAWIKYSLDRTLMTNDFSSIYVISVVSTAV